jgi:hypothetical protein
MSNSSCSGPHRGAPPPHSRAALASPMPLTGSFSKLRPWNPAPEEAA